MPSRPAPIAAALALGLVGLPASAQDSAQDGGTFSFLYENDSFGPTDRNYTNGLRASWVTPARAPSGVAGALAGLLGADAGAEVRDAYAVGHSIFTPRESQVAEPLPDQHPYAGHLYGEYGAIVQRGGRLDRVTVQLGLVGPSAGGEFVQNEWHDLIGVPESRGWDNQIGDEATVSLAYDYEGTALSAGEVVGLGFDLRPSLGATVGNVQVNARAGLTARVGTALGGTFGPPRVRPSLPGAGILAPGEGFSWYAFAGVQGRAVAHDVFLDGSFLDDGDPSVPSKTFVGDAQVGIAAQYSGVQLAYTWVRRTKAFDGQEEPQEFGALSLGLRF